MSATCSRIAPGRYVQLWAFAKFWQTVITDVSGDTILAECPLRLRKREAQEDFDLVVAGRCTELKERANATGRAGS